MLLVYLRGMRPVRLLLLALLLVPAVAHAQREKLPPEDLAIVEQRWPEAVRTSTGLRTLLLRPGHGARPVRGDQVSVNYTGSLLNGKVFDQNLDPQSPFTFRVGRGQVIDGWEFGLQMMQEGEKRLFIVPYELGYGTRGNLPKIPRRATLIFEVELLKVERNPPLPGVTPTS
jgi:FKBP-type peptidyl-prolyl cis-trans isomerase